MNSSSSLNSSLDMCIKNRHLYINKLICDIKFVTINLKMWHLWEHISQMLNDYLIFLKHFQLDEMCEWINKSVCVNDYYILAQLVNDSVLQVKTIYMGTGAGCWWKARNAPGIMYIWFLHVFRFLYRAVACLVTVTLLHSNTQLCPQSENYFPEETLCFWTCPGWNWSCFSLSL